MHSQKSSQKLQASYQAGATGTRDFRHFFGDLVVDTKRFPRDLTPFYCSFLSDFLPHKDVYVGRSANPKREGLARHRQPEARGLLRPPFDSCCSAACHAAAFDLFASSFFDLSHRFLQPVNKEHKITTSHKYVAPPLPDHRRCVCVRHSSAKHGADVVDGSANTSGTRFRKNGLHSLLKLWVAILLRDA